ncbi:MAG TPA: hypothetical protein VFQ53_26070 [Kofleriaceae bacterium]|nr:hypothetical protein [Kofleriaceae bacterium]
MRQLWIVVVAMVACAHNVPQDKATSEDGAIKGAHPIELQEGEATDEGIVTYPGGDRIDWKLVELPAGKRGNLDLTLTWKTPRPGLQLAFDVFDQWHKRVGESGKSAKRTSTRTRHLTIAGAKGKYFIRVYAVARGDAGRYQLDVSFHEVDDKPFDWTKLAVNPPPKLADLPGVVVPCDEFQPDIKNPECKKICWDGAPKNWPGCNGKCNVTPPDPSIPACAKTMDCPKPADRRVAHCKKTDFVYPCPDPRNPDPNNPNCDDIQIPPVMGRIVRHSVIGNQVEIVIMAGKKQLIEAGWTAEIVRGGTDSVPPPIDAPAMADGKLVIVDIDVDRTRARSNLTPTQVTQNKWVRLRAPPPAKP